VPPVAIVELEEKRRLPPAELKAREAELILAALHGGVGALAFAIGGAEGLGPAVTERAETVLSLGAMTWPHLLVRCMLLEQLYRAQQILAGHPYHRE
jgi:23S rRNA (pseudouridine1915-N3)-methyltransferase